MRIVFMGSPEFAVPSLNILVENGYDIVGVITATDKVGGRGNKKILTSAVKKYALENKLHIMQPKNLKNAEFQAELKALNADLQVVVAFRMLPETVWAMPPKGTMNLHGSLLPKYRGAAPINWAVMNGDKETGLTTFFLKHEIDTGDMLFTAKTPIHETDNVGDVHDRLMQIGADLVLKSVKAIEADNYTLQKQDASLASHAPKIFTETCKLDFNKNVSELYNYIRGLSPFPTAWTTLDNKTFKIYKAAKILDDKKLQPGSILSDNKSYLQIAAQGGLIDVKEVQLQGKKRMDIKSFLNGYTIKEQTVQ